MHKVAADLTRMLGSDRVLWEAEHLATYGFDGTPAFYAEAGCVTLPKTTAEVMQVVRYAAQNNIPVVTRGSGTVLTGGACRCMAASCFAWYRWAAGETLRH
jgi:glycolate oxidase